MTALRESLPPLPERMQTLPVDERGYPVPYFVEWINGKPDHRVVDPVKFRDCIRREVCWLCGGKLGVYRSFCIGPMCGINRISSEPAQHLDCATFAAKACPFLTRPRAQRRDANLPEVLAVPGGIMLEHNPGCVLVWSTKRVRVFKSDAGGRDGILFELGDPTSLAFYSEGRPATRAEVDASVARGLPALLAATEAETRPGELAAFKRYSARFEALLDRMLPP